MAERQCILLVDDYEPLRTPLARYLEEAGFDVVQAADGVEALRKICERIPEAIISDVAMPRMDGFQLRETLQMDEELRHIPFLFLTAYDSEEETLHGLDLEPDDFVSKSVSQVVLVKKVQTIIKRHESERNAVTADLKKASVGTSVQLLPEKAPSFSGFQLSHLHHPYKQTPGGDFFDYITVDPETMIVVLGDVQGKKWGAWMFAHAYMAYVRATIRSLTASSGTQASPAGILQQLNTQLCGDGKTAEILCTLTMVQLQRESSRVMYANAAHVPALLWRNDVCSLKELSDGGEPIGFHCQSAYTDVAVDMKSGDILLLATDGITDAGAERQESFSEQKLRGVIAEHVATNHLLHTIYTNALHYASSSSLDDDATLIEIRKV